MHRLQRFAKGVLSCGTKLVEADWRVASYSIFLSSRIPKISYISIGMGTLGFVSAILKNPTAGVILVVVGFLILLIGLRTFAEAPPLRWHILHDTITIKYEDDTEQNVTYTDTLQLRSINRACDQISYPISYSGKLNVEKVEQDGSCLIERSVDSQESGFYVLHEDSGLCRIVINLINPVKFGNTTSISLTWKITGATKKSINSHTYTCNTITDRLTFKLYFNLNKKPAKIRTFEEFGVKRQEKSFSRDDKLRDSHLYIEWEPSEVEFLHRYGVTWEF